MQISTLSKSDAVCCQFGQRFELPSFKWNLNRYVHDQGSASPSSATGPGFCHALAV